MDDPVLLARIQFAANISFHILFPTITIALGWFLLFFKLRFRATRDAKWMAAYAFWVKVFALSFALGVVSGITMSFQFGTNWPGYMLAVGNVAGPLLAYEVLTAFFLEATFLGVMLFGMNRVSGRVHIAASVIVAAGTTLSAFWILALNSWMQTPTGHMFDAEGELIARDWLAVIFNPSFPLRFTHMLLASGITAAFLVAGLSAWRLLKAPDDAAARASLRFGARIAAVLVPLQIVVGDLHGLNTLEHQPAKIAAMEALWETQRGAPLVLFALVDDETGTNRYAIEVPKLASLILTHDLDGEVLGIEEFGDDHPPVMPVFIAFRVMVGVGVLMLLVSWVGLFALRKGPPSRSLLWAFAGMTFSGWIAVLAGWLVTEIGRQPWLVTGILRTSEAAGEASGAELGASLTGYVLTYTLLLLSYMIVITHLARK